VDESIEPFLLSLLKHLKGSFLFYQHLCEQ
jgi:hypothetical protein